MKEGRKPEYPEKTPGDELHKIPRTTARRFKPQARLEPAQQHWWQARKADVLTVTPHVNQVMKMTAIRMITKLTHYIKVLFLFVSYPTSQQHAQRLS